MSRVVLDASGRPSTLSATSAAFVPRSDPPAIVAPAPQATAPAPVAIAAVDQLPSGLAIAYANRFDQKHTVDRLTGSSAVDVGNARGNVKYSTVFLRSYLEGIVLDDAAGKAGGSHELVIRAKAAGTANVQLAEKRPNGGYRQIDLAMFFCNIFYTVSADGATVTLTHIETG